MNDNTTFVNVQYAQTEGGIDAFTKVPSFILKQHRG